MAGIRSAGPISNAAGTGPATLTKQNAAKAWAEINHTSGTPTLRDGMNISSLIDSAVGVVDVNLTNAMASVNYAKQGTNTLGYATYGGGASTASQVTAFSQRNGSDALSDAVFSSLTLNGELA